MLHVGLVGNPLAHSWSADYFAARYADCRYRAYALPTLDALRPLVDAEALDGFNVTIPYKVAVLDLLDVVDDEAAAIGAVNCVCVSREAGVLRLTGYNTDAPAFAHCLAPLLRSNDRKALVLGTGGAARAVAYALHGLGIDSTFVSRQPHDDAVGYDALHTLMETHTIIVNATPVGMWPHVAASPLADTLPVSGHLLFDLVYNPRETRLMRWAADRGATVSGGLAMLHRQADLSYNLWKKQ